MLPRASLENRCIENRGVADIVGEQSDCQGRAESDRREQRDTPIGFNAPVVTDDRKQHRDDRGMPYRMDFSEFEPRADKHPRQSSRAVASNKRRPNQGKGERSINYRG